MSNKYDGSGDIRTLFLTSSSVPDVMTHAQPLRIVGKQAKQASPVRTLRRAQIFDDSIYSLMREAPRLSRLELMAIDFPGSPFGALAGAAIRHLALHVTHFHDTHQRSQEAVLTSVLADLPQLASLDMSFPKCVPPRPFPEYSRCQRPSAQRRACGMAADWPASTACTHAMS